MADDHLPDIIKAAPQEVQNAYLALTPLRRAFCIEYNIDCNGQQAAIRAGYQPKAARVQAANLITNPNVKLVLAYLANTKAKKAEIDADKVLQEIANTTYHNIADYFAVDFQGNLILKDLTEMPREMSAAIKKVKITNTRHGSRDDPVFEQRIEFELYDKQRGAELLGRHLKLFTDVVEHLSPSPPKSELEEALEFLRDAGIDPDTIVRNATKTVQ